MACSSLTSSSACPSVCPQGLLFPCGLTSNSVQIIPLSAQLHLWAALPRCERSPVPRAERAQGSLCDMERETEQLHLRPESGRQVVDQSLGPVLFCLLGMGHWPMVFTLQTV